MIVFFILLSILFSYVIINGLIHEHEGSTDSVVLKFNRRMFGGILGIIVGGIFTFIIILFGSIFQEGEYLLQQMMGLEL